MGFAQLAKTELVSVDESGILKSWNAIDSKKLATLQGHSNTVKAVAFDSKERVISGSEDASIKVWDTHQAIKTTKEQLDFTREAFSLVWAHDHKSVLIDFPTHLQMFDWTTQPAQPLNLISKPNSSIPYKWLNMTFDGEYVLAAQEHKVIVQSVLSGSIINELLSSDIISTIAPHPEKWDLFATGDWGSDVVLWNIRTSNASTLYHHKDWVSCSAFSPSSSCLASGGFDNEVAILDVASAKAISKILHVAPLTSLHYSSRYLATATNQGSIFLYDKSFASNQLISTFQDLTIGISTTNDFAISSDENYLLAANSSQHRGYVTAFDLRTNKILSKFVSHSSLKSISMKDLHNILTINSEGLLHLSLQGPVFEKIETTERDNESLF